MQQPTPAFRFWPSIVHSQAEIGEPAHSANPQSRLIQRTRPEQIRNSSVRTADYACTYDIDRYSRWGQSECHVPPWANRNARAWLNVAFDTIKHTCIMPHYAQGCILTSMFFVPQNLSFANMPFKITSIFGSRAILIW